MALKNSIILICYQCVIPSLCVTSITFVTHSVNRWCFPAPVIQLLVRHGEGRDTHRNHTGDEDGRDHTAMQARTPSARGVVRRASPWPRAHVPHLNDHRRSLPWATTGACCCSHPRAVTVSASVRLQALSTFCHGGGGVQLQRLEHSAVVATTSAHGLASPLSSVAKSKRQGGADRWEG